MKFIEKLKQKAEELKIDGYALAFAYRDKRTPVIAKLITAFTLGYLLSPIDLVPDFIPVIGYLDDLIIVPALITLSIKLIPDEVMKECRNKALQHIQKKNKPAWWFAGLIILLWLFILVFIIQLWI